MILSADSCSTPIAHSPGPFYNTQQNINPYRTAHMPTMDSTVSSAKNEPELNIGTLMF